MQKLQLHVGEPMRDVLAHNQRANYTPDNQDDNTPIIWPTDDTVSETFDVTYDGQGSAIHFSHAGLVWASQYAGLVTNLRVSTSDRKLPLTAFYAELKQVDRIFRRDGWAAKGELPSLGKLQAGTSQLQPQQVDGNLLAFKKNTVTATLQVKGIGSSPSDGAAYILDVEFSDPPFEEAQQNKAYQERMKVNGSINRSLKLSYWLNRP